MHKRNAQRRCWHKYGTPGAGAEFLKAFPSVMELWEEHVNVSYRGTCLMHVQYIHMNVVILCNKQIENNFDLLM